MPSGLKATLTHPVLVPLQRCADGLAALRIPQPQRLVLTARDDARAIRAEGNALTPPSCPCSGAPMGWPLFASHSRSVSSRLPETMRVPSGLKATLDTSALMPVQRCTDGLAALRIPQPQRIVPTARDNALCHPG